MSIYFKFKSAKDFHSVTIDGHFITVGQLKEKIFESKHLGRGTDFDLMISNAQTDEEYVNEASLIPKNTSVIVRRIPGRPRRPIVAAYEEPKIKENDQLEENEMQKTNLPVAGPSAVRISEESEWDEFGNDLYAIPDMLPQQSSSQLQAAAPSSSAADEDSKIKAFIDNSAMDWQRQTQEFGSGRGFGRNSGGRMMSGRGFGRGGGFERKTPPEGYICHRCKIPGHLIQHCPTNGDPNYDLRRMKPPTGIPKSMLVPTPDGSYALPSGAVAVLKPNEAAFEKEIEGIPTTRAIGELPPELHCPLCKEVMKDAVLTSKCCFNSFCDKCIRDHIISRLMCVCGATNILADDLLPNKTVRETISRIMESTNSSGENGGSLRVQDMESARCAVPKVPSPTHSANAPMVPSPTHSANVPMVPSPTHSANAPKVQSPTHSANAKEGQLPLESEGGSMKAEVSEGKAATSVPQPSSKLPDASEPTPESASAKEQTSQGSAPAVAEEEVQQKLPAAEPGKKKKKKKVRVPSGGLAEMQWRMPQDMASEGFGMPFGPSTYTPYWGGMQWGMDGFVTPYGSTMPYMGLAPDPFAFPFGNGMLPQDPFGGQGYMMPGVPPPLPRDLSKVSRPVHPPIMSREESEARKADLKRKREFEKNGERESRDKDLAKDVSSSADVSSRKSKSRPSSSNVSSRSGHRRETRQGSERGRERDPPKARESPRPPSKRGRRSVSREKVDDRPVESRASPCLPPPPVANDSKSKASVFSRISFPGAGDAVDGGSGSGSGSKKHKAQQPEPGLANGHREKEAADQSSSGSHHRASSNGQQHHHHHKEERKAAASTTASSLGGGGIQQSSLYDQESSDEEQHFKRRRPSRPESSKQDEEARHHRRVSREREHGSKHR